MKRIKNKIVRLIIMFFKLILLFFSIFKLINEAYKSKFKTILEKSEVFRILFILTVKTIVRPTYNLEISQKIFSRKIVAYNYNTILLLFREIFLKREYFFKADNNSPKIIDCGANIGMAVIYFKMLYPDAEIIAFEPNPFAFKLLEKNIAKNKLEKVILINAALSDKSGLINFYIEEYKGSMGASTNQNRGGKNIYKVTAECLSSYMINQEFDMIKIDVEGAECFILNDLVQKKLLNNSKRYIIEYHHKIQNEQSKLSEFLLPFEQNKFEYNICSYFENTGQFQDLLLNIYKSNFFNHEAI